MASNEVRVNIKPLSVNGAWQGKRFATKKYKDYTREMLSLLPPYRIPEGKLMLTLDVGFSSKASDLDNILKPFLDCLQKRYKFNDKQIYRIDACKEIVKKGSEYITFKITSICQSENTRTESPTHTSRA